MDREGVDLPSSVPAWIDRGFILGVLQRWDASCGERTIEYLHTVQLTKPGMNFGSTIFRTTVHYTAAEQQRRQLSFIIKTLQQNEDPERNVAMENAIFETETLMYTVVIPAMHRLLRSINDDTVLGARLIYHARNPHWVMVFEDLAMQGYTMNHELLDLDAAERVFAKLARWHAASMVLADTLPAIQTFANGVFTLLNRSADFMRMWHSNIDALTAAVAEWPGYERYAERIATVKDTIFLRATDIYTPNDSSPVRVLNHGDCHFKNLMFKHTETLVDDIMLLDFQLSIWGTPAIDIICMMSNSVSFDVRERDYEHLVHHYHSELSGCLQSLRYRGNVPQLSDLRAEIERCALLEFLFSATFIPFMSQELNAVLEAAAAEGTQRTIDLTDAAQRQQIVKSAFHRPSFVKFMTKNLPRYFSPFGE